MTNNTKLLSHFRGFLIGRNYFMAQKALDLMIRAFEGQLRKDGETPVWSHSLHVAAYLRTCVIPEQYMETVLTVALLHDVIEDEPQFEEEITEKFPQHIVKAVKSLDKNGLTTEEYYTNILKDVILVYVKGSDRIHNQHTMLGAFSIEKIEKYIVETETYVLPLLKKAKREYPEYEAVFEGMKLFIGTQLSYAKEVVKLNKDREMQVNE